MSDSLASPKICMVGSSNIDLIARVPRMPGPGETLIGSHFQMGYGGKGANQAVMAAKLGAQVTVVTKVGRDVFGEDTQKNYRSYGIDTTYLLFDPERSSGVAPITVDEATGQNSIIIVPGANDGLLPADVQSARDAILGAAILICQLEVPIATTLAAFRIAKSDHVLTILNPAPAASLPDELLHLTDVLVPNEIEAAALTGLPTGTIEEATIAAQALRQRGPHVVIITLGNRGAVFVEGEQVAQVIPAEVVQAVDSSGAGDAFVGSLAYLLGMNAPMAEAVRLASAIATRSVLKPGTQSSYPTRDEVLSLLTL